MADVTKRIDGLTALEARLVELWGETNARLDELRAEMGARFAEMPNRAEMSARFEERSRHFEILLEAQRRETRLVTEGLASLGERMDLGFDELRELIGASIRFWEVANLDLERRLRHLEERS